MDHFWGRDVRVLDLATSRNNSSDNSILPKKKVRMGLSFGVSEFEEFRSFLQTHNGHSV